MRQAVITGKGIIGNDPHSVRIDEANKLPLHEDLITPISTPLWDKPKSAVGQKK
jgi:hypothetical protein